MEPTPIAIVWSWWEPALATARGWGAHLLILMLRMEVASQRID